MAHQIKDIRDRLDKVAADGTKFGLVSVDQGLVVQGREMTYPGCSNFKCNRKREGHRINYEAFNATTSSG